MVEPPDEIVTERLTLRRAVEGDLAAMHAILSHPVAMRHWSTPPHADVATTSAWLEAMIAAPRAESDDYMLVYEGRVIGKAGCWRLPEIGYILHPDAWGRGLAREALVAIIPTVFAAYPVAAIVADVDPCNAASLRLLERLGFQVTGRAANTWCVAGAWSDSVYLSLSRP